MIVEKWQDTGRDGIPIGSLLVWRGEWDRSPSDCAGRDRDPMPVLYLPGGQRVVSAFASDWRDVSTGSYPEGW